MGETGTPFNPEEDIPIHVVAADEIDLNDLAVQAYKKNPNIMEKILPETNGTQEIDNAFKEIRTKNPGHTRSEVPPIDNPFQKTNPLDFSSPGGVRTAKTTSTNCPRA